MCSWLISYIPIKIPIHIQIPIMSVDWRRRLDHGAQRQRISYGTTKEMHNIYEYDVELLIFHHVRTR